MKNWKRLGIGPYEAGMFVIVLAASLLRIVLISHNWPATNSDEGTMDLMALHIAYRGEHPIFYYGQDYMGPIEAYLGALCFRLFGVSLFTLRLGLIPFFALFLVCMYFLTRRIYTRPFALATVVLLSLGSSPVILYQLRAIGGYPEIVFFAASIFLLASQIVLSSHLFFDASAVRERRWRWLAYAALGLLIGVALWTDQLILPCMLITFVLLFIFCRVEIFRSWAGIFLLLGLIIGASPLIYYNLTAPPGHNSLVTLLNLQRSGVTEVTGMGIPLVRELLGTLFIGLPMITSYNPLCDVKSFPLFGTGSEVKWQCAVSQGGWSLVWLLLWVLAFLMAARVVWKLWPARKSWSFNERQECIRQCIRLMLLLSGAMTFGIYAISPPAARVPDTSFRYLICVQVSFAAILWPLWHGIQDLMRNVRREKFARIFSLLERIKATLLFRIAVFLLLLLVFFMGTIGVVRDIPNAQAVYQYRATLAQDLVKAGATRIYSDYWTCNWLTFQSQEQIVCAALSDRLKTDLDRYLPYRTLVQQTEHPAYVFSMDTGSIGPKQRIVFEREILPHNSQYQRFVIDGYVVYIYKS